MSWLDDIIEKAQGANTAVVDTLNQAGQNIHLPSVGSTPAAASSAEQTYDLPDGRKLTYDELKKAAENGDYPAMVRLAQGEAAKSQIGKNAQAEAARQNESPEERKAREDQDALAANTVLAKKAEVDLTNARISQIQSEISQANDPIKQSTAQANLATAQAQLARANMELQRSMGEMSPEAQIKLKAKLDSENNQQNIDARRGDTILQIGANSALEDTRAKNNLELDTQRGNRDLITNALSAGVQARGQDITRLKAQDDMAIALLQQQVAAGKISLDKATSLFTAQVTKARLPSEILATVAKATEPYLPYATNAHTGDTPLGFETGGSRDMLSRLGGNTPSSYDPSKYAVKTTPLPFNIAQASKVPNVSTAGISNVAIPTVPKSMPSATAGIGNLDTYTTQMQGQQAAMGAPRGPIANAMPPAANAGPTEEELKAAHAAMGG